MKHLHPILAACFALLAAQTANAHIVLTEPQAIAGSYYKATLRVGHGCSGSSTTGLTVQVPAGFQGAKPQPKTGWAVTTHKAQLAMPYNSHGKTVTDDVVELRWKASSKEAALSDDQFDEFAFMGRLPDQAGPLWVKVLQTCESGQNDWSETPASGTSTRGMKLPAALLDVQAAPKHDHHH
ncbi:YcnI family protein [Limnohabitans sp.]|uniref:YcnI family copper-binding membrane protein n=1 Tax=Limnohabitans sp. TaxID=1907725 RepID=UPI00286F2B00|nr:YcnI family protein [Limnohabitans sp.]